MRNSLSPSVPSLSDSDDKFVLDQNEEPEYQETQTSDCDNTPVSDCNKSEALVGNDTPLAPPPEASYPILIALKEAVHLWIIAHRYEVIIEQDRKNRKSIVYGYSSKTRNSRKKRSDE